MFLSFPGDVCEKRMKSSRFDKREGGAEGSDYPFYQMPSYMYAQSGMYGGELGEVGYPGFESPESSGFSGKLIVFYFLYLHDVNEFCYNHF